MDPIVELAMAKWPNVPAVYGWLALDRRGQWSIKSQPAGGTAQFEPVSNAKLIDFIGRNYAHDEAGRWYFQNGPQRVFVSLEATPFIYRLDGSGRLQAHTGAHPRELQGAFADAEGHLFLETELGPGLVDSGDSANFAERLVDGEGQALDDHRLERWMAGAGEAFLRPEGLDVQHAGTTVPVARIGSSNWANAFGFVARPGDGKVN